MNKRPRRVEVGNGYLTRFAAPLWDKLDLENCRALMAVEGHREGCHFIILDLEHLAFGLMGGDGRRDTTTFFIAAIPESIVGRRISWRPTGFQASADGRHVYVACPGEQARPGVWSELVHATIKTARSLKSGTELGDTAQPHEPAYRPVGAGVAVNAFWAWVMLAFSALLTAGGLGTMLGWIDYRPGCMAQTDASDCQMAVWRAGEAFLAGCRYLLASGVCWLGVFYYRERARKRQLRKPG